MQAERIFKVQGRESEPYTTRFRVQDDGTLTVTCTCSAGENGSHCKHRIRILCGNPEGIVSGNESEIDIVREWLRGTPLEVALADYVEAESQVKKAQERLKATKKRIAQAFWGR